MPADPFETPLILTEATILPTSLVYIRRTCGPILFPDLLSIPIHRLAKPFFKINGHSIPERLLRSVDRGLRISHVSRAGCFMNRFDVDAEDLFNLRQQIEHAYEVAFTYQPFGDVTPDEACSAGYQISSLCHSLLS